MKKVKSKVVVTLFTGNQETMDEIAALHLNIRRWQESMGQNSFTNIHESQDDLTHIDEYYVNSGGNFFVAKDIETQEIIGFVGLRNDGDRQGAIKRLAVIHQHRRQGVATALMTSVIEWVENQGFAKLSLTTGKDEKARPLYEKFGFSVTGFLPEHNDWIMELVIKQPS